MPRHGRIDFPGALHHIIARGINRQKIFNNNKDRSEFLDRLEKALQETQCQCLAWSLMPNHLHLLIRTRKKSLSDLMRRICTGYALYFNKKYGRRGYLFQNRYKSILCQEDAYLLELVRYIHLNPIRSNVVAEIEELDRYQWTGHSAIMENKKRDWQEIEVVLAYFGKSKKNAKNRYREYMVGGLNMGKSIDYEGGGLKRSAGGWEGIEQLKKSKEKWRGDERILGDGNFVNKVLRFAEEDFKKKEKMKLEGWNLVRLEKEICKHFKIRRETLQKKGRNNTIADAKGLLSYIAFKELDINQNKIGEYLGIRTPSVNRLVKLGEIYWKRNNIKLIF